MPRQATPLTDSAIKAAKPKEKPYKLTDGQGLYLEVIPTGSKLWRLKYRYAGKEKRLAFGIYPSVSLQQARQRRTEARELLANAIDPGEQKKINKQAQKVSGLTFETLAREWFDYNSPRWAESTRYKAKLYLENDVIPNIGSRPLKSITLRQLNEISGGYPLLFPGQQKADRPMSENTINKALRLMGYEGRQTGHGFRHLLSTELNGRGYNKDWIERQLAHGDNDEIRATYNHANYLQQRREMMQAWADSVDRLSDGFKLA